MVTGLFYSRMYPFSLLYSLKFNNKYSALTKNLGKRIFYNFKTYRQADRHTDRQTNRHCYKHMIKAYSKNGLNLLQIMYILYIHVGIGKSILKK